MNIEPRLKRVAAGQRLTTNLFNSIIRRIEYAGDMIQRHSPIAGDDIFVEQQKDGRTISYLQQVAGGVRPQPPEAGPTVTPIGWMASRLFVSGNPNLPYAPTILPFRPGSELIAYLVPFETIPFGITWNLRDSYTADTYTRFGVGVFNPPNNPFLYPLGGTITGISIDKGFNIKIGNILSANGPKIINIGFYKDFLPTYVPGYYPGTVPPNSFSGSGYKAYWSSGTGYFDFSGTYIISEGIDIEYGIGEIMS